MLMKAYDSRWAAELIKPYLADDGILAGVQNGMTTDTIADVVGARPHDGHRHRDLLHDVRPRRRARGTPARRARGSPWAASTRRRTRRREDVAALLRHSGTVEVVDDIRATKWMKIISNATVLVPTAIVGLPMADAIDHPGCAS